MKDSALKFLFISNSIFVFAGSLLGPLYAIFVANIDQKIFAVSFSWAVFLVSSTFFTFLVAKLSDKTDKDRLLVYGFLLRAVSWLLFIFVGSVIEIISVQIVIGLGEAVGTPAFNAIFAEHLDRNHHMEEYSRWKVIENLATAAGTVLGGIIATLTGFKSLFIIMALLATISAALVLAKPTKLLIHLQLPNKLTK